VGTLCTNMITILIIIMIQNESQSANPLISGFSPLGLHCPACLGEDILVPVWSGDIDTAYVVRHDADPVPA
jgi:hypothetical protein